MDSELTFMLMELNTKEIGKTIYNMEKELKFGLMEADTKVNI